MPKLTNKEFQALRKTTGADHWKEAVTKGRGRLKVQHEPDAKEK